MLPLFGNVFYHSATTTLTDRDIQTVVSAMRMRYRRKLTVVMPEIPLDYPFLQKKIIIKLFIDMAGKIVRKNECDMSEAEFPGHRICFMRYVTKERRGK